MPVSQQTKVGFHGCYEQRQHQIADRIVLELERGAKLQAKHQIADRIVLELERGAKLQAKHKIIGIKTVHFQDYY